MKHLGPRICPDCGSPARGNPCYARLKNPDPNYDMPCDDDDRIAYLEQRSRETWRVILITLACGIAAVLLLVFNPFKL